MKISESNNFLNNYYRLNHLQNKKNSTASNQESVEKKATDLRKKYTIHAETKQLILKIYDSEHNKIIKEIPSEEVLDLKAKIIYHVGLLLDRRI